MQALLFLAFVMVAAASFSLRGAYAIVSEQPTGMHSSYQDSLLVAFFTIICSTILVTLVFHYYRMQWGRKSILTE
jgi:ABC-type spermidine/putrescine transport system permease subunit II